MSTTQMSREQRQTLEALHAVARGPEPHSAMAVTLRARAMTQNPQRPHDMTLAHLAALRDMGHATYSNGKWSPA